MVDVLVGYAVLARWPTDPHIDNIPCLAAEEQDLTAQRDGLARLGLEPSRI